MLRIIATILGLVASLVHGLTLDVTPDTIEIGITRNLQVKCSTSLTTGSVMSSLISLIISRDKTNNSSFTEVAAINVFDSATHVVYDPKENVTATGKIDNNGLSYITLVWDFPDQSKAGVYRCEANGVDHGGHPVYVNTGQTVAIVSPSVDVLVNQVQVLTSYIEQVHSMVEVLQNYNLNTRINQVDANVNTLLNQNLNNRISQVDANIHTLLNQNLNTRIDQLNTNVRDLQSNNNLWNTRMEAMKNSLFYVSERHDGNRHRYLLSHRLYTVDISRSETTCIQYGGYLAEMDSYEELDFVTKFVRYHTEISFVLIGGSDEKHEGQWVNPHSGTPTYVSWASGDPNGGASMNCLFLWRAGNLKMGDDYCYTRRDEHNTAFLCEVPA